MKKWKIILSIFVLVLAAGGGTLYYFLNVKEYKTADRKVEKIVKSDYDIQLPDENSTGDSTPVESKAIKANQSSSQTVETTISGNSATAVSGNHTSAAATREKQVASTVVKPKKLTSAEIIGKYQPVFQNLESQANGKLSSLLSYAISEYQTKKSNGEEVSYFYFYSKYTSAAKSLEASTDSTFYYVYNALVKELRSSGYSANAAEPIKNHYLNVKKQRRNSIMSQAMSHGK
ncbi:hypothetical protein QE429_000289 [Bacillus sp. SORGH_AS 510]|uniref:hypothetical protein n=1 Tax=Bacillus sp. SORGH_AS_0510 TaxID=3041771 RepID=UPI00277F2E79|nr:hypothetical protein [Bacillus sp. SORGH_AS_0510]MDQ1143462.1 hypothetical protein [Bacillus sp. SORGH_AS_0510]